MSSIQQRLGHRNVLVAVAVVLAILGALAVVLALRWSDGPPQPVASTSEPAPAIAQTPAPAGTPEAAEQEPAPAPAPADVPAVPAVDFGPVMTASPPLAIDIPVIGVHSTTMVDLTVGADGVLPAPTDYALPGWHTLGPTPGQFGPSVIAGHVDGPDGPAVFYRLGELVTGDQVDVTRQDGTVARFTVDEVGRYAKNDFPTSQVYGNTTNRAEIRLITCGGAFDRTTGHYVDNIVVFGHLTV